MTLFERAGLAALRRLEPETAHGLALRALNLGLGPKARPVHGDRLACQIAGLTLPNPIGLAAGFDKNATALAPLTGTGFGFVEVGAVTPRAQPGNAKPRLFRLTEDRAAINRFGFNNDGMEAVRTRLEQRPTGQILGLNLGANKDSVDRAADFASVLSLCGAFVLIYRAIGGSTAQTIVMPSTVMGTTGQVKDQAAHGLPLPQRVDHYHHIVGFPGKDKLVQNMTEAHSWGPPAKRRLRAGPLPPPRRRSAPGATFEMSRVPSVPLHRSKVSFLDRRTGASAGATEDEGSGLRDGRRQKSPDCE